MKFATNLAADDGSFDLLEPGWYDVKVVEALPDRASTGKPFLGLEFVISGPASANRHLWCRLYLTEKASWKTRAFLNAIGLEPSDELDATALLGRPLAVKVVTQTADDDSLHNEVDRFRPLRKLESE